MRDIGETIILQAENARVEIALKGAEPISWCIDGCELLWSREPAWWDRSAPILFPVVGASQGGQILVNGKNYPMPLHGFAKDRNFQLTEKRLNLVRMRLESDSENRLHFPFDFVLDVTMVLSGLALQVEYEVINQGKEILPYALGFHPGFKWSNGAGRIDFEIAEEESIPRISPCGLLSRQIRLLPMQGCVLSLTADTFSKGALVFRNARSQTMTLVGEAGAIRLQADGFRHLAVWSKASAPFVCLEAWTAHADWEDFVGELSQRDDMIMLEPGHSNRHGILLEFTPDTSVK